MIWLDYFCTQIYVYLTNNYDFGVKYEKQFVFKFLILSIE